MRIPDRSVALAISAVLLVGAAPATRSFDCDKNVSGYFCQCKGEDDCAEMRHSGQCAGSANCQGSGDNLTCSCNATRAPPRGRSGAATGEHVAPTEAPPPTSAKPP